MKTVITYGTFDLFHYGHLELLKRCSKLGSKLIVGLSTDEFNLHMKGKTSIHPYETRKENLEAIKYVDIIIPETKWNQKEADILKYQADFFVMGDDWKEKFDHLNKICKVIYLKRTPDISSSLLKTFDQIITTNDE